nr:Crp/Fnr family transcriptional regulator [Anaerolineae bacterium]
MEEFWNMRGINLFSNLSSEQIEEVLKLAPPTSYRKGEFIFLAGDAADALYILQLGTVKVSYIALNGDEKVLNIFRPGDIFGELFLGKYRHRIGEAQALDDVIVFKMCEETFLSLTQRLPQVALNFIRHLADSQRETLARTHALMRADARYRLAGVLLSMTRRYCCTDSDWFELPGSVTQEDIANMAGLNRSTVSSLINELRRDGILGGAGRSLHINRYAIEALLEDVGLEVLE